MEISLQALEEIRMLFGLIDASIEEVYSFITNKLIEGGILQHS